MESNYYEDLFDEHQEYDFDQIEKFQLINTLTSIDTEVNEALIKSDLEMLKRALEKMFNSCISMKTDYDSLFTLELYYTSIVTNILRTIGYQKILTSDHLSKASALVFAIKNWKSTLDYFNLIPWFASKLIDIADENNHKILMNQYVSKAIEVIYGEIGNPQLSTAYVANHIGLSANYLSLLFKDDMGETPAQFIKRSRVKMAAFEIGKSDLPLSYISEKYGFRSQSQFTKAFKNITGETPLKYKLNTLGIS